MSRRVFAGLAVLAAVASIFVLWPKADQPLGPTAVISPVAEPDPVEPAPLPETPRPAITTPEFDAGALTGIVTALVREGSRGSALRNAQGEEASRPTDVMGLALFELAAARPVHRRGAGRERTRAAWSPRGAQSRRSPGHPTARREMTLTDDGACFELLPRIVRGGDPVSEVHLMRLGDAR